ncbi:hypothetical protein [Nostoc punctiforme]|uniref:Uncharacterized protein n=1 Tax=Nostoc punctiforme (strain ATCC 29133 / PCC 73102) TaxID=63737 RepID=B2IUW3_NOSP7|nr:hypothetical protein [Nostoc punctiforme]ACC84356.1 hypothetical protein Npun_F6067 [Nostoc punctiforme PCC 73102]
MSEEIAKRLPSEIEKQLPPWFASRLLDEESYYGLLTTSGTIIGISEIRKFSQMADGSIWMDVLLIGEKLPDNLCSEIPYLVTKSGYTSATINVSQIIAAFDLGHHQEN